jgi:hypothetical protein
MANTLSLAGAQPQKQTRFAPIYTGRWSSGIWTNRSPLRDANTTRISEKYYGAAGDALIAGSNVEITNRLTLGRRPGNPVYDNNTYSSVDRFEEFRMFAPNVEKINVMADQSDALYSLNSTVKSSVWTKSTASGQSYMQSVGNSLYFANGADQKKWLQSLWIWNALFDWTGVTTPVLSTYIVVNGNIQQLTTAGVSGSTAPTWSTVIPSASNLFQGGKTTDGTAIWTNRGLPVENWGIVSGTTAVVPTTGTSSTAWRKNTYFSFAGVIIDPNGNLQQVTTQGISGSTAPTWNATLAGTTTDGTAVWTMLQTAASMIWAAGQPYASGHFIIAPASGTECLFQLEADVQPSLTGAVSAYLYNGPHSGPVGCFILTNPTSIGTALAATSSLNSFDFVGTPLGTGATLAWDTIDGSGNVTTTTNPFPGHTDNYQLIILGTIHVPVGGQYSFTIKHHDGMIWGIGGGATKVSGTSDNPTGQTVTAANGYPVIGGTNRGLSGGGLSVDTFSVNFDLPGDYPIEVDYSYWYHSGQQLNITCNGQVLANGTPKSGATSPIFPVWGTSYAPLYPSVTESAGQFIWQNLGPVVDFTWAEQVTFTLPNTVIIDPAGITEGPYRTGVTGALVPTFATGLNQLTLDNPNLIWINQGLASAPASGTVSVFSTQGWIYGVALVNTLDNTVSNCSPVSAGTGPFIGSIGVVLQPGAGLPPIDKIDPQSDFVAIFRTTDGQSVPFLIPGATTTYTVPLATYLATGYTDATADVDLNNLISGAIDGENTPPGPGALNLTFHLGRIFFSIGNYVYWTSGSDTPVGNGVNGVAPLNFDGFPSLVKRIVPTSMGALVFTVSDVYVIQNQGLLIQPGVLLLPGIGISSYNALDMNGPEIGFFTTDRQFLVLDPASGTSFAGFPIGDQLRLNNGKIGQSWNPANVYVAHHVDGEDQAWYIADGANGWFRLMPTPAPETGYSWSPFATIVGGCKAVQSIEVTPGEHKLLLGPVVTGPILNRDQLSAQDNGQSYPANAVIGSAVLAQPGQVAMVTFITTESVNIGTPLYIGMLIDEALPYYTGPFDYLKEWVHDPPGLKESRSILGQRFYLSDTGDEAVMRHCQIQVNWPAENALNELLSLTIFGGFSQEL